MNGWVHLIIIWLTLDALIIAGIWYGITVVKTRHPQWWKQVIVDDEPDSYQ